MVQSYGTILSSLENEWGEAGRVWCVVHCIVVYDINVQTVFTAYVQYLDRCRLM